MVSTNNIKRTYSREDLQSFLNHSTFCFWLKREVGQMPNTEELPYQIDKSSHRWCSIKIAVFKNFAIFTRKHLCWVLFFINCRSSGLQSYLRRTLWWLPLEKSFRNTYFEDHLRTASELTLWSDCLELCFWTVTFEIILTQ